MWTVIDFLKQLLSEARTPTPLTLLDAAAWTQCGLIITVCVCSWVLWKWTTWNCLSPTYLIGCAGAFAVVFLLCVAFRVAFDVVFAGLTLDLIIVAVLVGQTGGSEVSPFVPLYLMLPTFGLVAAEPLPLTAALYLFAGLLFLWTLFADKVAREVFETAGNKIALALITGACCAGTFYLDTKSHELSHRVATKLETALAEYELDESFDEIEQELASLSYDQRRARVQSIRWKHVHWNVKFYKWFTKQDKSDTPDPETLRFSIKSSRHPGTFDTGSVDLRWIYGYPPTLESGQDLTVSGILTAGDSYNVTVMATDLKE